MVYLAKELDKQIKSNHDWWCNYISRAHTAVKIACQKTVIHVNDASRAVTVAGSLLNSDKKYAASIREEYDAFRDF
jgi:5-methyltetrahydrofolate--homocysteine methyltransferase